MICGSRTKVTPPRADPLDPIKVTSPFTEGVFAANESARRSAIAMIDDPHLRVVLQVSGLERMRPIHRLLTPAGLHRFSYANIDPISMLDPTGLSTATEASVELEAFDRAIQMLRVIGTKYPVCTFHFVIEVAGALELNHDTSDAALTSEIIEAAVISFFECRLRAGRS